MQTAPANYISPRLAAGAASTRTPADVLAARASSARAMPIGRMFLIEVDHKGGSYFTETDALPRGRYLTDRDGLAALKQHDDAIALWELNPSEGSMRDVSEDMARLWLKEIIADRANDFQPEDAATWPTFLTLHLTNDEAAREARGWAA